MGFPFGMIVCGVASILLFFGVGARACDRLGIRRVVAAALLAAAFAICFVPGVTFGAFEFNLGGFVLPALVGFALFFMNFKQSIRIAAVALSIALLTFMLSRLQQNYGYFASVGFSLLLASVSTVVCALILPSGQSAVGAMLIGLTLGDLLRALAEFSASGTVIDPLGLGVFFDALTIGLVMTFLILAVRFRKPSSAVTPVPPDWSATSFRLHGGADRRAEFGCIDDPVVDGDGDSAHVIENNLPDHRI